MTRKIFYFFIIFAISHCGFSPIYNNINKIDYSINMIEMEGDNIINNLINSEIKRISRNGSKKIYNLKINTQYEKIVISKNSKGIATNFQAILTSVFIIDHNNAVSEISFQEKKNFKNISSAFEQKKYEDVIKKNFAVSIIRKLNLELLNKQ